MAVDVPEAKTLARQIDATSRPEAVTYLEAWPTLQ